MKHLPVLVLAIIMVSGCTQSSMVSKTGQMLAYIKDSDVQILDAYWAFEDECYRGNASVAYVGISCEKDLECEVYVNDVKSNYGLDGLQPCSHELVAAEIELAEKPDFIAVQSGEKYYYTRRDRNRFIEICCSYVEPDTNKLNRDYETCKTIRLEAQCPEQTSRGFGHLVMQSWKLYYDGTLEFKIRNEVGQDISIRRIYINDESSTLFNAYVSAKNISQTITVTGAPRGVVGNSYSINLAIEYKTVSNPDVYLNSTGTINGQYAES